MRIVIERNAHLKALAHSTSVVERRTTIPILSNVLLNATKSDLELKATDLEREVIQRASADVSQTGAVTVPAHMLHDIVRKLPDGAQIDIRRDPERERLALSSGSSRFALQTLPADDFPDLGGGEFMGKFEIAASDLKRLIEKTRFAISTEETRYYLNGIFLHVARGKKDRMLRAVATDGHRLAQVELACPRGAEALDVTKGAEAKASEAQVASGVRKGGAGKSDENVAAMVREQPANASSSIGGIIVPRKTVHELHRMIEDSDAKVTVSVSPARVRFEVGQVTLTSKLIDGTFPDYGRVIPQANDKELTVPNADFMAAVDRVATIASERSRAVKLNIAKNKLVLSVNNPDGGSATEELEADYGSSPLEIGFNARYLLDIAGQLDGDKAVFKLADPGSPTMICDRADENALYVLMPMRV